MNMASTERFIRTVQFVADKVPTVILYDERQIQDIMNFCFDNTGGNILSFDIRCNLGSLFVTASAYTNMALTRKETGDATIFMGPLFLHGNSDVSTYNVFFGCLSGILMDTIRGSFEWALTMNKQCGSR